MANFKNCKNLKLLAIDGAKVTDAGLIHFKGVKELTDLGLRATRVTDVGLAYFHRNRRRGLGIAGLIRQTRTIVER